MKVLLVDTNRAAVPIYQALLRHRHQVWVVGRNPSEPLAKICPRFVQMDYADTKRLASLVKKHKFSALIPGCTDVSYRACAEVSRGRFKGVDLPEVVDLFQRKDLFRELASSLGLPIPRSWSLGDLVPATGVIIKPVDSFSGRGISILSKPTKKLLRKAIGQAKKKSPRGAWLAEEFVPGQLFSYSAFLRKTQVSADFVVQENCVADPFAVDLSRVSHDFPAFMRRLFKKDIEKIAAHLSLGDGLIHAQLIVRGHRYWFIEITRRCPGDLYSLLIEYSTGYPYAKKYVLPFIQNRSPKDDERQFCPWIIRHTASFGQKSFYLGFSFPAPTTIKLLTPLAVMGDSLQPGVNGRVAIAFFSSHNRQEHDRLYGRLAKKRMRYLAPLQASNFKKAELGLFKKGPL